MRPVSPAARRGTLFLVTPRPVLNLLSSRHGALRFSVLQTYVFPNPPKAKRADIIPGMARGRLRPIAAAKLLPRLT